MGKLLEVARSAIREYKKLSRQEKIDQMFSWIDLVQDDGCKFANGGGHRKWKKRDYEKLIKTIIKAVELYEPWIFKQYDKHGGLKEEYVKGGTFLGRYLSDNNSPIYSWFCLQWNICTKCLREYGQPYYANKCSHNDSIPEWKQERQEIRG